MLSKLSVSTTVQVERKKWKNILNHFLWRYVLSFLDHTSGQQILQSMRKWDLAQMVEMRSGICHNLVKMVGFCMHIMDAFVLVIWIKPVSLAIGRDQDVLIGNNLK